MQLQINNIKYVDKLSSNAKLIVDSLPQTGQTPLAFSQDAINSQTYPLSIRNSAGAYLLPVDRAEVFLNFIPMKRMVFDAEFRTQLDIDFTYFTPPVTPPPELYTLPDGFFFRCAGEGPKPKEQYTYYIMRDGVAEQIPNYKTLEVMLAERGQTLLSVRVIEENQCNEIPKQGIGLDLESQWTEDYKDQTNPEVLKEMEGNVKSGAAIADAAKAAADQQIAAVKAAEEKAKEEATAAKAKSMADKATADAAIAQAQAAQAAAEAAKAQADLEKFKIQNS